MASDSFVFSLLPLPALAPGERVLASAYSWAISGKSLPSYRLFWGLPPLFDIALIVTDRRLISVGWVARLLRQDFYLWMPGMAPSARADSLIAFRCGRNVWGPYLEVDSETVEKQPLRARQLRVRWYIRNPQRLEQAIGTAIAG